MTETAAEHGKTKASIKCGQFPAQIVCTGDIVRQAVEADLPVENQMNHRRQVGLLYRIFAISLSDLWALEGKQQRREHNHTEDT